MTFGISDDDVSMNATTDWTDLLGRLVDLQGQWVTVRIEDRSGQIANMRGLLSRTTSASKTESEDALLLWIGETLPVVSFVVARELLSAWTWIEDHGVSELRLRHGTCKITIDFSPGAGRA